MCLAHSLTSRTAAADWLHQVLEALFPKHRCGPGCEVVSGSQSLAEEGLRNLLASVQESPAR